jgi:hypothetical protein
MGLLAGGAGGHVSVPFTISHRYFTCSARCRLHVVRPGHIVSPLELCEYKASDVDDILRGLLSGLITCQQ